MYLQNKSVALVTSFAWTQSFSAFQCIPSALSFSFIILSISANRTIFVQFSRLNATVRFTGNPKKFKSNGQTSLSQFAIRLNRYPLISTTSMPCQWRKQPTTQTCCTQSGEKTIISLTKGRLIFIDEYSSLWRNHWICLVWLARVDFCIRRREFPLEGNSAVVGWVVMWRLKRRLLVVTHS